MQIIQHNDKSPGSPRRRESKWTLIQLTALALICLVFILIALASGIINMRTLNKTLERFVENQGASVAESVRQSAETAFRRYVRPEQAARSYDDRNAGADAGSGATFQERFLSELMALVREIDAGGGETATNDALTDLARTESLGIVAILDVAGNLVAGNRPIPEGIARLARPVIDGKEEFAIRIFDRLARGLEWGFVAARRSAGSGSIILGLNAKNYRGRCITLSLSQALGNVALTADMAYILIYDRRGRVIASAGDSIPEQREPHPPDFRRSSPVITKLKQGDARFLEFRTPVAVDGTPAGVVFMGFQADAFYGILRGNRKTLLIYTGFMIGIALMSIFLIYRNQSRYIDALRAMENQVQRTQRLSALGRLAAGVAHEIRNPLNAISIGIQRIQKESPHRLISVIRDEIGRLNRILDDFLSISRRPPMAPAPGDVRALLDHAVLLAREEAGAKGVDIRADWPDRPLMVNMDPDRLKQALINIIRNGLDAVSGPGTIHISAQQEGKRMVRISVRDTGTGLSPEEINRIFDPDYTTKDRGVGLGLPIAHEIIQAHNGRITVEGRPGKGTTVDIDLPLTE